jgi:two-component system, chemotaxis family, sensor kinase CheA
MDDLVKEFLVESYESLDRLDRDFVELEKNPSQETLKSIFRAIHTIKGTCGFLSFSRLEAVTHVGENLLSLLRDGKLQVTPQITDALLALVDAVREMLALIESTGNDGERDYSGLIDTLGKLQNEAKTAEVSGVELLKTEPPAPAAKAALPKQKNKRAASAPKTKNSPALKQKASSPDAELDQSNSCHQEKKNDIEPADELVGEILLKHGHVQPEDIERALTEQAGEGSQRLGEIPVNQGAVKPPEVYDALQTQADTKATVSDSTVRVDVGLLDKLMNLVGELVLSRNQIMQFAATQENTIFLTNSQHLNLVTTELQEGVMKTRMQPIGNIWNRFPRVVRDLAASCGKQVQIEMEGAETEIDRTIIEAIKDPMTHVVRNSVDHGIESPEARVAAGKPAEGRLFLHAFHEGGQVNIEISDDGGGIDPERIKDKALQRGLISQEHAARMSEREIINLIFLPGLSTAEQVTNVSGRGVGMDVVKTNIEKIGGTIDVQSKLGQGTTLKVKIPLTLAIIPALMVTTGGDSYAIPQVSLLELVRLEGDQARKGVEMVHGAPVYRLRGNLLPLVYLADELNMERKADDNNLSIVVLQADGRQFGLVVDKISDSKDIVVKPLGKHLKGISAFSGAAIMGDGKVALILDILGISQTGNVVSEARERALTERPATPQEAAADQREALLVLRQGKQERIGIPLSMIARLEEFPLSTIEKSGGRDVVQYRGEIMPLVWLSQILNRESFDKNESRETVQVVVYRSRGRSVGLVVDRIVDIVEDRVAITRDGRGSGLLGSAVVQGRVTDVLDVAGVIESAGLGGADQVQAA